MGGASCQNYTKRRSIRFDVLPARFSRNVAAHRSSPSLSVEDVQHRPRKSLSSVHSQSSMFRDCDHICDAPFIEKRSFTFFNT